jgi:hypothetical protein
VLVCLRKHTIRSRKRRTLAVTSWRYKSSFYPDRNSDTFFVLLFPLFNGTSKLIIKKLERVTDSRNLGLRRANRNICSGTNNGGLAAINPKEYASGTSLGGNS